MIDARHVYDRLLAYYGKPEWWPGTPYEIIAGAILVQNTTWRNAEKTLAGFGGRLSPEYVRALPCERLRGMIRPSGFYTAKADCLKRVTEWYERYDCSAAVARGNSPGKIYGELIGIKGVGPETAEAIMLYALRFPVFVADAYTKRLLERLGAAAGQNRGSVKNYFIRTLPEDTGIYGDCHSLILTHAKRHCKKKPLCAGCPLAAECAAYDFFRCAPG